LRRILTYVDRNKLRASVVGSYEAIRSLRARVEATRAREQAADETLELVQARFDAGDAIQLEVLEAAREVAEARAGTVASIIAYNQTQHLLYYQVNGAAWGGQ
jgi:outer membrane protein TolC